MKPIRNAICQVYCRIINTKKPDRKRAYATQQRPDFWIGETPEIPKKFTNIQTVPKQAKLKNNFFKKHSTNTSRDKPNKRFINRTTRRK